MREKDGVVAEESEKGRKRNNVYLEMRKKRIKERTWIS